MSNSPIATQFWKIVAKFPVISLPRRYFAPLAGVTIGLASLLAPHTAHAESPQTAPAQVQNTLKQIDAAANRRDIKGVIEFYSPNFTHGDGLNRQRLESALTELWQLYSKLSYTTELQSWQPSGTGFAVETVTKITGLQSIDGKNSKIESTLRSRQQIEDNKIVRQEILSERTQTTTGVEPPVVELQLPEKVRIGQDYSFDAIVQEPLGNNLLMGTALEQPVRAESYLKPLKVNMELLTAGGLFKLGKAPIKEGNYWISAVLVRSGGITTVTQRLQVVDPGNSGSR